MVYYFAQTLSLLEFFIAIRYNDDIDGAYNQMKSIDWNIFYTVKTPKWMLCWIVTPRLIYVVSSVTVEISKTPSPLFCYTIQFIT